LLRSARNDGGFGRRFDQAELYELQLDEMKRNAAALRRRDGRQNSRYRAMHGCHLRFIDLR
jgi:hypothetical protein